MKISNRRRFARKLKAFPEAVKAELRKALETGGEEMSTVAKAFAPVRSGALRDSIGWTFGPYKAENANVRGFSFGGGKSELAVTIHAGNAKAFYAAWVEFGTAPHKQRGKFYGTDHPGTGPHPYFWPAYRLTRKRSKSRITRAINKAAKRVAAS